MQIQIREINLSEIHPNPSNPRTITEDELESLSNSILEFPEMLSLREIVVDETMTVLGGNQRYHALERAGASTCIAKIVTGLTEEKKKEFIIRDNVNNGKWDFEKLANEWDMLPLSEWGVDLKYPNEEEMPDIESIEVPRSALLEPPLEYIVIIAQPNSEEWEELKQKLQLGIVRRAGYRRGSPFESVGLERVLKYEDFKIRVVHGYGQNTEEAAHDNSNPE